jgi:hypothetical protein
VWGDNLAVAKPIIAFAQELKSLFRRRYDDVSVAVEDPVGRERQRWCCRSPKAGAHGRARQASHPPGEEGHTKMRVDEGAGTTGFMCDFGPLFSGYNWSRAKHMCFADKKSTELTPKDVFGDR